MPKPQKQSLQGKEYSVLERQGVLCTKWLPPRGTTGVVQMKAAEKGKTQKQKEGI
jgi:hypothetical protein